METSGAPSSPIVPKAATRCDCKRVLRAIVSLGSCNTGAPWNRPNRLSKHPIKQSRETGTRYCQSLLHHRCVPLHVVLPDKALRIEPGCANNFAGLLGGMDHVQVSTIGRISLCNQSLGQSICIFVQRTDQTRIPKCVQIASFAKCL